MIGSKSQKFEPIPLPDRFDFTDPQMATRAAEFLAFLRQRHTKAGAKASSSAWPPQVPRFRQDPSNWSQAASGAARHSAAHAAGPMCPRSLIGT